MSKILVVGSANIDLVMMPERLPRPGETLLGARFASVPGGKGANQAVAAARAGGAVAFIGCVGADAHGDQLAHNLRQEGIDLSRLSRVAEPSGVACVITADGDTNMIVVASGANALLDVERIDEAAFRDARIVLAQLETPMASVVHTATLARQHGATFILDPAPAQPLPRDLLSLTDWLTPNESEAQALAGGNAAADDPVATAMLLRQQGAKGIVLKLGARGALLLPEQGDPSFHPAYDIAAVDTTAAGDAFNGAFAVALGEGADPRAAVDFAIAASAIAVTRHGAQTAMANRAEIQQFAASHQRKER